MQKDCQHPRVMIKSLKMSMSTINKAFIFTLLLPVYCSEQAAHHQWRSKGCWAPQDNFAFFRGRYGE